MTTLALTELLGATVYDPSGAADACAKSLSLLRKTVAHCVLHRQDKGGKPLLPLARCRRDRTVVFAPPQLPANGGRNGTEGLFLLERDLLDQQVIDVNGRKVVRVNDVDLEFDNAKIWRHVQFCVWFP